MVFDAYVCYAPSEKEHAEVLARTLGDLETAGSPVLHWDQDVTAGSRFSDAVRDRIDEADVVLLLMSKAFLNSNFCQDQLNHAIDNHMLVIPIILESCDWMKAAARQHDFLPSDSNPVSTWKNKADAYADIAEGVVAACERYGVELARWSEELGEEESAILTRLYPDKRLDGLDLWDAKYAWNSSYLPAFIELLSDKKYIDRDFYFSVTFPFWRQRFWLTKRGRRVAAEHLDRAADTPYSA